MERHCFRRRKFQEPIFVFTVKLFVKGADGLNDNMDCSLIYSFSRTKDMNIYACCLASAQIKAVAGKQYVQSRIYGFLIIIKLFTNDFKIKMAFHMFTFNNGMQ
jgi:hypothetical protein